MAESSGFIPARLLLDQDFQRDVRALLGLAPDQLKTLRGVLDLADGIGSVEAAVSEELVRLLGGDRAAALRLAFTMHFLMERLAESSSPDASALVEEVASLSEAPVSDAQKAIIAAAISPSAEQRVDRLERDTFAFGDTFLGVQMVPIYSMGADDTLYGGASITVRYRTADNHRRSLSINASAIELQEIADAFRDAKAEIDGHLARLRGAPA